MSPDITDKNKAADKLQDLAVEMEMNAKECESPEGLYDLLFMYADMIRIIARGLRDES